MQTESIADALDRAAQILGSQKALADAAGVSSSNVSQWKSGHRPVPRSKALAIHKLTRGKVSKSTLNPTEFPPRAPTAEPGAEAKAA